MQQDSFHLAGKTFTSRLIVGTGKYRDFDTMRRALDASGAEVVTVAVRRERLFNEQGRSLLEYIDLSRYTILPNTAGCFTAEDAVRVARLGREILEQLNNPGASWVKLEVLGDKKTLLPDPVGTLDACRELVKDGFDVLCYTSDDPIMAMRIKEAGAASVMPAGSPIGSGQGVLNRNNIAIILELLKGEGATASAASLRAKSAVAGSCPSSPSPPLPAGEMSRGSASDRGGVSPQAASPKPQAFPVILDAGVGNASDVSIAMELGADGVLLNTAIAHARDPVLMASAMRHACLAGRESYLAGRIPKRLYASASSPWEGRISHIQGE